MRASTISILTALLAVLVSPVSPSTLSAGDEHSRRIDEFMHRLHECGRFNGSILVAENGEVIYKEGLGLANVELEVGNEPDTRFRIGSLTKSFTAVLIMQLVEEGKLKLEDKITTHLPDYPRAAGDRITIEHLLAHKSGIPDIAKDLPQLWGKASCARFLPYTPEKLVELFSELALKFEPGERFNYCNSGYILLGAIIETVSGKTYERVLRERILDPLGMKNTGYSPRPGDIIPGRAHGYYATLDGYQNADRDNPSLYYAAGGMYSTVEDLYLWDRALYSEELLSEESKELMFTPRYRDESSGGGYGYGWGVFDVHIDDDMDGARGVGHSGDAPGFFACIRRFVDEEHLIALATNTNALGVQNAHQAILPILRILHDLPYDPPKASIARALLPVIRNEGVESGVAYYRSLEQSEPHEYVFEEGELNTLGYHLLGQGRVEDAIQIFKLNVEQYPDGYNTYDSLGEAYMVGGIIDLAKRNYRKSLELNPDNKNAVHMLEKLEGEP